MTGVEFTKEFERHINKSFSQFYTPPEQKELFAKSILFVIEELASNLKSEGVYRNLGKLIKSESVFLTNKNKISIKGIDILNVSISNPATVTTKEEHNLITGDIVELNGLTGSMVGLNKVPFVVTFVTAFSFQINSNTIGSTYTASTGYIYKHKSGLSVNKQIDDYLHLLCLKAKYYEYVKGANIVEFQSKMPYTFKTVSKSNNLKTGDFISIIGVLGLTNANGDFYVKKISDNKFSIYYDSNFLSTPAISGTYGGGGIIKRIVERTAYHKSYADKHSRYCIATALNPYYEFNNNYLQIYPKDVDVNSLSIDYISNNITYIDPLDSVFDLTIIYPLEMIYKFINRASTLFYQETRDYDAMNMSNSMEDKNKRQIDGNVA